MTDVWELPLQWVNDSRSNFQSNPALLKNTVKGLWHSGESEDRACCMPLYFPKTQYNMPLRSPECQREAFYGNAGLTEGCCWQLLSKGPADCSYLCRGFSSFWPPKGHDRVTTKRINDNWLRVSCNKQFFLSLLFLSWKSNQKTPVTRKNAIKWAQRKFIYFAEREHFI